MNVCDLEKADYNVGARSAHALVDALKLILRKVPGGSLVLPGLIHNLTALPGGEAPASAFILSGGVFHGTLSNALKAGFWDLGLDIRTPEGVIFFQLDGVYVGPNTDNNGDGEIESFGLSIRFVSEDGRRAVLTRDWAY